MLNIKVLSGKMYGPTSRLIRDCLQEFQPVKNNASSDKIWVTRNHSSIYGNDYIVRWGNPNPLNYKPKLEINTAEFVRLCGKKTFSDFMLDYSIKDLDVVRFFPMSEIPEKFPVVLRKTLFGYRGKGIYIINSPDEFKENTNPSYFWSNALEADSEYRVHIVGGNVKRIFKKIWKADITQGKIPIRSSKTCRYSLRSNFIEFKRLLRISEELSEIIPFYKESFFAFDIGLQKDNGKYIIYELNTAPGLSLNTAKIYAEWIWNKFLEVEKT